MPNQQTAQLLDGKSCANSCREELKTKIDQVRKRGFRAPGLVVVLIGDNPASQVYVKNKVAACKKAGIESYLHQFPKDATEDQVLNAIETLNDSDEVDGILVQLPLPAHLPTDKILHAVRPDKDVDGLHPYNLGLLMAGKPGLRPCTPKGVMVLLERYNIPLAGANAVVIGRSNLVGKPVALMLQEQNATVTMCHSKSKNLEAIARSADILVVAAGRECMVKGNWLKPGAVVIDVGINRRTMENGEHELVGDVDFQEAVQVASLVTPVPGGVGPMTVAMLLSNTFLAYQEHILPKG